MLPFRTLFFRSLEYIKYQLEHHKGIESGNMTFKGCDLGCGGNGGDFMGHIQYHLEFCHQRDITWDCLILEAAEARRIFGGS